MPVDPVKQAKADAQILAFVGQSATAVSPLAIKEKPLKDEPKDTSGVAAAVPPPAAVEPAEAPAAALPPEAQGVAAVEAEAPAPMPVENEATPLTLTPEPERGLFDFLSGGQPALPSGAQGFQPAE